jgi:hypothetical protein
MWLKIILNVLLNLGIFTMGLCIYWALSNQHYTLTAGAAFALTLLIVLKIRLVKNVREVFKENKTN